MRAKPRSRSPESGVKFDRLYGPDELALFAAYIEHRADHRPRECTRGERCWVTCGPPSFRTQVGMTNGGCIECGGAPR